MSEPLWAARKTASASRLNGERISKAQALHSESKTDQAVQLLTETIESEKDPSSRALSRMALAVILFRDSRDTEAEAQFTKVIEESARISDYAYLYRGLLRKKMSKLTEARADLERVISLRPPLETQYRARLHLGEVLMALGAWKGARDQFHYLSRRTRSQETYPEVLYHLIRAEIKRGRRQAACKTARELYSKHPTHALVRSWGPKLALNKVDNAPLGCRETRRDLQTRVRRLQLGGEAERASAELRELKASLGHQDSYSLDSVLANHLANEGQVEEAMKLLLAHYESQRNRVPYLNLLAKVAARAGDYQAAIGAYQRAYDLAPRSWRSTSPLFQAAFTSYQIQDYDGATQKFTELVKSFPRSSLVDDAKWYLAWMRYLKGDYPGAYQSLTSLAKTPKYIVRRGRRRKVRMDALSLARIHYWTAMSQFKMGNVQAAIPQFQSLARDPAIGYYSVLSYYRLKSIPGAVLPAGVESRLGLKKSDSGDAAAAPSVEELQAASEAVAKEQEEFESSESQELADKGEAVTEEEDVEDGDGDSGDVAEVGDSEDSSEDVIEDEARFKDPGLALRFERARDLTRVGLMEAARLELLEIEKRASKTDDRRLLMNEYVQVRNFYRSSYMGEVRFGSQRLQGGLKGESRHLWEFAYPKAWEATVADVSKSTSVPPELIWGIMRAESHFRDDARSVVGALGLMQLMPYTARQVASLLNMDGFATHSLLVPDTNIRLGTRYLQRLLEKFSGSIPLVAAGYNAGPHRVHAWVRNFGSLDMDEFIEHIPFVETRNYVKKVVRNYQVYSLLYSGGEHSLRWLVQPVGIELHEPVPTKEIW